MRRFWRQHRPLVVLSLILALFIIVHVVADQLNGVEADRWVYYSRCGLLATTALVLALLTKKAGSRILPQVLVAFMLLVVADLGAYFLRGLPPIEDKRYDLPDQPADHPGRLLGELPDPGRLFQAFKIVDGDTVYRAAYTIDEHYRRVTPGYDSSAEQHALFFGCSVCFGQWVSDVETLPARFQSMAAGVNAYNYSFPGWGVEQMLARLESMDLAGEVNEPEGIAVYVFLWSHISRAIGNMYMYCNWGHQHPYYELIDGKAVRNKRFKDGRPLTSKFYELAWRSNIVRLAELPLPLALTEDHLRLHLAILRQARDHYLRQFPAGRFVVLWAQDWPEASDADLQARFLVMLREEGIDLIDGRRPHLMDNRYTLKDDGHPTPLGYADMAVILHRGLADLGWQAGEHR